MRPVNQSGEVLHPPVSVWILEEHAAHVLPTEVHLMRQFQYRFNTNVAAAETGKTHGLISRSGKRFNYCSLS